MSDLLQNPSLGKILLSVLVAGGVIAAFATFLFGEISKWRERRREKKAQDAKGHADVEVAKTQLKGDILGDVFDRMDRLEQTNERQRESHVEQMRALRQNHREEVREIRRTHDEQMQAHIEEKQELREQLVLAKQSKEQLEETNARLRRQNERLDQRNEKLEVLLGEAADQ